MSTKIYDAYQFDGQVKDLLTFLFDFRKKHVASVKRLMAKTFKPSAEFVVSHLDQFVDIAAICDRYRPVMNPHYNELDLKPTHLNLNAQARLGKLDHTNT